MNQEKKRVIIIGATGTIGGELYRKLQPKFSVVGTTRSHNTKGFLQFSLGHNSELMNYVENDVTVIFAAAESSPDLCKNDYKHCYQVNVINTKAVIRDLLNLGAKVIFTSSDAVYGEQTKEVFEEDLPNPKGFYGEMKQEIESTFVGKSGFKSIRLSYVASESDKFYLYLKSCTIGKKEALVFESLERSVISIRDVCTGLERLIQEWENFDTSCINFCGPELLTREKLAKIIKLKRFNALRYQLVSAPTDFFDQRAMITNMQSNHFARLLGRSPLSIDDFYNNQNVRNWEI